MHDETYKKLFAFPRMVEDLLRGFVAGPWSKEIDFSTLEKLSAEYVSDELLARHGDAVWRVRLHESWLYLLVLLEFQSQDEPRMALRILAYTSLLYQELVRNGAVGAGERLPAVLPVVLYNGESAWRAARDVGELIARVGPALAPYQPAQRYCVVDERRVGEDDLTSDNLMAAVVRLEKSRTPADLLRAVDTLRARLAGPGDGELRRAFFDWVRQAAERLTPRGEALPPVRTLEEARIQSSARRTPSRIGTGSTTGRPASRPGSRDVDKPPTGTRANAPAAPRCRCWPTKSRTTCRSSTRCAST